VIGPIDLKLINQEEKLCWCYHRLIHWI